MFYELCLYAKLLLEGVNESLVCWRIVNIKLKKKVCVLFWK